MLPAAHRLRESAEFQRVTRKGRRAGSRTLVAHLAPGDSPAAVGFVVSKQVGGSVARNRVKRRLRHAVSARLDQLPDGARLVVRALPASAAASYEELGTDLDRCLQQVTQQRAPR